MKRRPETGAAFIARLPCPPREATGGLHDDELGCGISESHLTAILLAPRILIATTPWKPIANDQSQDRAPPDWYSMTRVSKKLRSFFRSIISLIQGNGFSSFGKSASRPICWARRLAM